MLKQDGFAPSENRLVLGMGKYSLHTVLDSSSTILFLSKGLYISSSAKKYITLDYLIIYTSYARSKKRANCLILLDALVIANAKAKTRCSYTKQRTEKFRPCEQMKNKHKNDI